MAFVATSFACWVQRFPERVYTHAAPILGLSKGPPTMAVFPSVESETDQPCSATEPMVPVPTSFACWLQTSLELAARISPLTSDAVKVSAGPHIAGGHLPYLTATTMPPGSRSGSDRRCPGCRRRWDAA